MGQVALLDERDGKAAAGGVEGHPAAGDAAADHEDVHPRRRQAIELAGPPLTGQVRAGHGAR